MRQRREIVLAARVVSVTDKGERMNLTPVPSENRSARITEMQRREGFDWVKAAASGSLIAGGLLLLTGQKRAGLVLAASGTALALLEHEENLRNLWNALPGYVDRAQSMFDQVREVAEEIAEKGRTLRGVVAR
jgi:hypothetical protein